MCMCMPRTRPEKLILPNSFHTANSNRHTYCCTALIAGPRPCESCDTSAGRLVNITVRPIAHVLVSAVVLRRSIPPSGHGAGQACFQIREGRTSSGDTTRQSAAQRRGVGRAGRAGQAICREKRGAFHDERRATSNAIARIRACRAVEPRDCGEIKSMRHHITVEGNKPLK